MRWLVPLVLLSAGCSSEDAAPGGGQSSDLVSGLSISEVSLNQAVKVPLMQSGQLAAPSSPVVAGRPGLLRVAVTPEPSFAPREVVARLALGTAAGATAPLEVKQLVGGPSSDADLASTFNFEIPGESLPPDATFSVSLHEASGKSAGPPSAGAAFPASGAAPIGPASPNGPLRMVLVPLQYDADGSGRLPELGDEQVALYRERLRALYPVADIEIRIHEPIAYDAVISPNGNGWGEVLQFLLMRRNQDRIQNEAAANEYYYGLFAPKASFALYCSGSPVCVLGLSTALPDPTKEFVRGSVGIGFVGNHAADTLAHETGHAHGRLHAPCAPYGYIQNVDPAYPHPEGRIGVWGWSSATKSLLDPGGDARDFMGYCDPAWVSDYTWKALFERVSFVNSSADTSAGGGGGGEPMYMVSIDGEGRPTLGRKLVLSGEPGGELRSVDVLDEHGGLRRREPAYFHPYSHLPGGFLLVRGPEPGDRALGIGPRTLPWGGQGKALPSH